MVDHLGNGWSIFRLEMVVDMFSVSYRWWIILALDGAYSGWRWWWTSSWSRIDGGSSLAISIYLDNGWLIFYRRWILLIYGR
ncbi:hypothetical protein GDO81_026418 [Engystomops pustulosus]|uniref:Uncharacterized protein n=1 Tax=Engystomops pustulosus TaxID=76066 RepID=A0AAV6Z0D9_ENGPU|nr:hypothetical protein GDO81_026418 [Engystomops pustulosus]